MASFLIGYLGKRIVTIYATNEYSYERQDLAYSDDQMNSMNYTLGRFNETFGFTFGFANAGYLPQNFDALNNPYVEFLSGEFFLNENGGLSGRQQYEIENCP